MNNQLEIAKQMLFGQDGLRATNFKLFPGSSREVTSEEVAAEIVRSIKAISEGDFEFVDMEQI